MPQFSSPLILSPLNCVDVHNRRHNYAGSNELFDLACNAASGIWLSMIQAVKILAWRLGNESRQTERLSWNEWFFADIQDFFTSLETLLTNCWKHYPNAPDAFSV